MQGRLQRSTRWLRLALASLAVATGAVPAQARAATAADVALVVSPSAAGQRSAAPVLERRSQRSVRAPAGFIPQLRRVRFGVPEPSAPAPRAKLFLAHRALLR